MKLLKCFSLKLLSKHKLIFCWFEETYRCGPCQAVLKEADLWCPAPEGTDGYRPGELLVDVEAVEVGWSWSVFQHRTIRNSKLDMSWEIWGSTARFSVRCCLQNALRCNAACSTFTVFWTLSDVLILFDHLPDQLKNSVYTYRSQLKFTAALFSEAVCWNARSTMKVCPSFATRHSRNPVMIPFFSTLKSSKVHLVLAIVFGDWGELNGIYNVLCTSAHWNLGEMENLSLLTSVHVSAFIQVPFRDFLLLLIESGLPILWEFGLPLHFRQFLAHRQLQTHVAVSCFDPLPFLSYDPVTNLRVVFVPSPLASSWSQLSIEMMIHHHIPKVV